MDDSLTQLTSDIETVKWLLAVVTVMLLVVTAMLVFAFKMMLRAARNTNARVESNLFNDQADLLLDEGKHSELRELSQNRLQETPGDAWAHYYLGIACYRQRDYVEAKRCFKKVGELSPMLKKIANENLEEVEMALVNAKPRLV